MKLEDIIKGLHEKRGTDIHDYVVAALKYMEFDAYKIENENAEPDIIAISKRPKASYMLVIEVSVAREGNEVISEKIGQIKANGARYIDEKKIERHVAQGYLMVLGSPKFSKNADKSSQPDVCLLTIEELIALLENYEIHVFSHEELEEIFRNYGLAKKHVEKVITRYKNRVLLYGLVCLQAEQLCKENNSFARIEEIVYSIKTIERIFKVGIPSSEHRIKEAILSLGTELSKILRIEQSEQGSICRLSSQSFQELLPRMLGKCRGEKILIAYEQWKKSLRNATLGEKIE